MDTALQPATAQFDELLSRYDVGELVNLKRMAHSGERYLLNTRRQGKERQLMLSLVDPSVGPSRAYIALLDACDDVGLPVAAAIRNRQGNAYETLNGSLVMLSRRLTGQRIHNPTLSQVEAMGRFIARLHAFCSIPQLQLPPHRRDPAWLNACLEGVADQVAYDTAGLLGDTLAQVISLLQREDVKQLPVGTIHANLLRDNALFNERGITGVVGFRHAGEGYLLYDLAVAANDWCSDANGIQDPERTLALLRAYQRLRPITRQELWFLSNFSVYAALVSWLERLTAAARNGRQWLHNPEELRRTIEQHTAHSYYLDERLLV